MYRHIEKLRKTIPELPQRERPRTVPCIQCGKPVEVNDATMLEKGILCRECCNRLRFVEGRAKA